MSCAVMLTCGGGSCDVMDNITGFKYYRCSKIQWKIWCRAFERFEHFEQPVYIYVVGLSTF